VRDIGDGSQDALLVRVEAGGFTGWGECEAAPLVSIASWVCPMSHSACKPVRDSVLGQRLDGVDDIRRIHATVRENSMDLLQADHTLSGIDIALWDLLGKKTGEPVYRLLGYERAFGKTPYASQRFGDDAAATHRKAQRTRRAGYTAAKFGWGPIGRGTVEQDAEQFRAAREGLGPDALLLVDAGTVWGDDVEQARSRLDTLEACNVTWLEEPFVSGALSAYRSLSEYCDKIRLAGGEGCNNVHQARHMIDYAGIGFIQIDAGRIGGITAAKQVADYAHDRGVTFVNHTFTTPLALSASLQPFAGLAEDHLCEVPVEPSALAQALTIEKLLPGDDGCIHPPEAPGLGVEPDSQAIRKYAVNVEITVAGQRVYTTPSMV
jgi:L-alanine-DL-glutamate epimerase-like enolase superfamily enzyme